jgi:hypothetical protein
MQQRKILAVVIGVAFGASRARLAALVISTVQPAVLLQLCADLTMTFSAVKFARSHRLSVAPGAVGRPVKIVMWPRQRPRRYLRVCGLNRGQQNQQRRRSAE